MATAHIVASSYTRSNVNYVSVTNEDNMYDPVSDTSDYATLQGRTRNSSTAYYAFINGFKFSDLPSGAVVKSFAFKIRCYRNSYQRTGTNFFLRLSYGSTSGTVVSGTTTETNIDTTAAVIEIPTGSLTWEDIVDYGSDFAIEVPLAGTSGSYAPIVYVYGAEIEVEYTIPNPRTITTELTGNGTIVPSGSTTSYDGEDFTVTITPTDTTETVTVTKNGTDVTEDLTKHYIPGSTTTDNRVLGTYALVSGGFNGSGASYFSGLNGKGHTATTTSSNYYSSGSGVIAVFTYDISFTLPAGSVVTNLYVMVSGHAESTSNASEYMCAQIVSGSEELSDELNFKSVGTSNSTQTITAHTMPTVEQAANLKLQCRLGYYGGALNGATCYIEYEVPTTEIDYYTYTFEVSGDTTIEVNIGGGTVEKKIYYKNNGTWVAAVSVYKKVNCSWVQQTNLSNVFDANTNYVKG